MAIIGTFTRTAKGFSGNLKTLTLTAKLQFVAETDKAKDSAPDYRVYLGTTEVGAAWKRTARDSGREYWSALNWPWMERLFLRNVLAGD